MATYISSTLNDKLKEAISYIDIVNSQSNHLAKELQPITNSILSILEVCKELQIQEKSKLNKLNKIHTENMLDPNPVTVDFDEEDK